MTLSGKIASVEARLKKWPRSVYAGLTAILALILSLIFFSPCWWVLAEPAPGSFEWSRGIAYLDQCEQPFRPDVAPALRWRLLPPLLSQALGLHGALAFFLPWIGVACLLVACALWFESYLQTRVSAAAACILIATTSAVLVPTGWLGVNDAWVWLALLGILFSRREWIPPAIVLAASWLDERFVIALPLAWWARHQLQPGRSGLRQMLVTFGALLPYAAIRCAALMSENRGAPDSAFLAQTLSICADWLPFAPLGWWMGLRLAWLPVAIAMTSSGGCRARLIGLGLLLVSLGVAAILAADLSRSVSMLLPLVALGVVRMDQTWPALSPRILLCLALAALFIPACHVVADKLDLIDPLPVELFRILH